MSKVDHVTLQVVSVESEDTRHFMAMLGFSEIPVEEKVPDGWKVRWFTYLDEPSCQVGIKIHLVELPEHQLDNDPWLGAGHLCLDVPLARFNKIREYKSFVERDSSNGRLWLAHSGMRVELRAEGQPVEPSDGGRTDPEIAGPEDSREWREIPRIPIVVPDGFPPMSTMLPRNYERTTVEPQHYEHSKILDRALQIYKDRTAVYGDRNWRREGWRGSLFNLRRKVERAWDVLWSKEDDMANSMDVDDLLDVINYAVFSIRAIEEGNAGEWWK